MKQARFRLNCCFKDSLESCIVILPDGSFNNCDLVPLPKSWGNIFDGVTDPALFAELRKPCEIDPGCAKCPFLPVCTPFYRHGCPDWFENCRTMMRREMEIELRMALPGAETD